MAAETQYTANTGIVKFSAANTSLTGGTIDTDIFTLITGASNGTLVKKLFVKTTGNPSQGMFRLFVYDGASVKRLLMEIPVDPIIQSVTDPSFERTISLDFKLESGHALLVSSQTADEFVAIAEGLDFSYYTASVRPESTQYTANNGLAVLASANTSMEPTSGGTVVELLTATASYNGTAIDSISIKATAAIATDCIVRFFIYRSSTYYIFKEVFVPAYSTSGTYMSFEHKIVFPDKFQLKTGDVIYATTSKDAAFHIVAEAMDWTYPGTAMSNFTPASGTAVTTEEKLHALQVPAGMVFTGNLLRVYASILTNATANNKTFRIYINSTNTLTAATLLGTYVVASATLISDEISRFFPVLSNTVLECHGGATASTQSQYGSSTGTSANVTVPSLSAGFWILISGQKATAGDTDTIRWSMVNKVF